MTNGTPSPPSPERTNLLLSVRGELYNELRSYRDKEFQTFSFAFPIVGSAFVLEKTPSPMVRLLLTGFAIVAILYIFLNHDRMNRLKRRIEEIQLELCLTDIHRGLSAGSWADKPLWKHVGTITYLLTLAFEAGCLWYI